MSTRGIEGDPFAAGELPHDELIELARILNDHVAGYRDGGARDVAAAIMRAGYRKQAPAPASRPVCGNCQTYLDAHGVKPGKARGLCSECSPVDRLPGWPDPDARTRY